jgi:catechol 2,3-dioxygenase-like lactoylglutathione lyase family enzyme
LPRAVAFFKGLDFVKDGEREESGAALDALTHLSSAHTRVARLHLGTEHVELRVFDAPVGRPIPEDTRSNDAIFQHMAIVVSDMDAAFTRLNERGVKTVSLTPQTIPASNPAAGGVRALYFRDPDLHHLEVIWFPAGKGNPRWHTPHPGTFLGIDHSAVAVMDTDRSQRFYEGLAFSVAGRSLNFGVEQESLSGVPGARVRITSLAPPGGPAVEFLSYLAPGAGRPVPADTAVNDVWHWEITVEVPDVERSLADVDASGGHLISAAPVDIRELETGYRVAALVTDVDGHCLRLVQR